MGSNQNILMNKYDLGELLGEGNFGKVYHGRDLKTGQSVAIKVINKEKDMKAKLIEQTKREITSMNLVKHPNVVKLYEVMATKKKIFFIMEYVKGGELLQKVSKAGKLKENEARKWFVELISALDICHNRGVYHRDLKLENLLLDENGSLKITDFGLSAVNESKRQDGLLYTTCGTPAYVAPEVMTKKGYDGVKADIWSSGVILFAMLAGFLPFPGCNFMEIYRKMNNADYKCPDWFPSDLRKLLSKILNPNPCTRISISKIKNSSWFRKGYLSHSNSGKTEGTQTPHCVNDSLVSTETTEELLQPADLNAFDIISFSSGFNLFGLFKDAEERDEVQFTSLKPFPVILSNLETISKEFKMKLVRKDKGLWSFEEQSEDFTDKLYIDVGIFEITPAIHLVEFKLSNGDTIKYRKMLKADIKPALKDIIWTWPRKTTTLKDQICIITMFTI